MPSTPKNMHIEGFLAVVFSNGPLRRPRARLYAMAETHRSRHQVFGLSGRIGQKRLHSSSAGPARSYGHTGWTKETSTGTIEGAHRASTRISNLCACAPSVSANLRPARPSRLAPRTRPHATAPAFCAHSAAHLAFHTPLALCTLHAPAPRAPTPHMSRAPHARRQRPARPCAPGAHVLRVPHAGRPLPRATRSACPVFDTPHVPRQAPHVPC